MRISETDFKKTIHKDVVSFLKRTHIENTYIDKDGICKNVSKLLSSNEYHPKLPNFLIDYDKQGGVSRPVIVMNPEDTFVYFYCTKKLEKLLAVNRVAGTYGGWRMGGKFKHKENAEEIENEDSPGTGLNPAIHAQMFGEFNSKIKKTVENLNKDYKAIEIDIANFYDCIRLDRLEKQIRAEARRKRIDIVDLLFYFLTNSNRYLHSYRPQSTGIPQDMLGECSRLLANFYLQDYDKKISNFSRRHSIKYLRFADDQIFFVPKDFAAEKIVKEASRHLYHLGLNINANKVKTWSMNRLVEFRCIDIYKILDLDKHNKDQAKKDIEKFANEALKLIKKDKDKRTSSKIKNGGLPLIKKIINLDINKLDAKNRKDLLRLIYEDAGYVRALKSYNLKKLYDSLDEEEKHAFLDFLNVKSKHDSHSAFTYEVMLFRKQINLSWKRYAQRIKKLSKEWAAV